MKALPDRWKMFLFAFLVWALIYLPGLGKAEFRGEEAHRTLPAVTMLKTGNWAMPFIAGEPYFNKPPGINWLVAVSYIVTGEQNEFTSRVVSAVSVLGLGAMLIWMPSRFMDKRGRLMAAIIFFTTAGIIEKGRLIEIEAVYIALTGMAVLWWMNVYSFRRGGWLMWLGAAPILGYGMLTKGPLILVFFYFVAVAVLFYDRNKKQLLHPAHFLMLIIFFGMNYVWARLGPMQYSREEMGGVLIEDMLLRIVPKSFGYWFGNIIESFASFLPWTLFIPALWDKRLTRNLPEEHRPLFKGARLGLVIGFLAVILLPRTETRYVMPVYAIGAIMIGWVLALHKDFYKTDLWWRKFVVGAVVVSCFTAVGGIFVVNQSAGAMLSLVIAILASIFIISQRRELNNSYALTMATGVVMVVYMLQYASFYLPRYIEETEKFRPAVAAVHEIVPEDETIYIFHSEYETWLYYIREPFEHLHEYEQIDADVDYMIVEKLWRKELGETTDFFIKFSPELLYSFEDRIKGGYQLFKLRDPAGAGNKAGSPAEDGI